MIDVKSNEKDIFYSFEIGLNTGHVTFINDVKLPCNLTEYQEKLDGLFEDKKGSLTIASERNVFSAALSDIAYVNVSVQGDLLPFTEPTDFEPADNIRKCDDCVYHASCLREKDAMRCAAYREA